MFERESSRCVLVWRPALGVAAILFTSVFTDGAHAERLGSLHQTPEVLGANPGVLQNLGEKLGADPLGS